MALDFSNVSSRATVISNDSYEELLGNLCTPFSPFELKRIGRRASRGASSKVEDLIFGFAYNCVNEYEAASPFRPSEFSKKWPTEEDKFGISIELRGRVGWNFEEVERPYKPYRRTEPLEEEKKGGPQLENLSINRYMISRNELIYRYRVKSQRLAGTAAPGPFSKVIAEVNRIATLLKTRGGEYLYCVILTTNDEIDEETINLLSKSQALPLSFIVVRTGGQNPFGIASGGIEGGLEAALRQTEMQGRKFLNFASYDPKIRYFDLLSHDDLR